MKYYLNLTNGIEYKNRFPNPSYIRIQSSLCEAKKWDKIMADLDYNFLLELSQGQKIMVVDGSQKKQSSRALYQGLEFIKFVLNKRWLNKQYIPFVRGHNCTSYFSEEYKRLSVCTKKKLDYFKKLLNTNEIHLGALGYKTKNDGNYQFYKERLKSTHSKE